MSFEAIMQPGDYSVGDRLIGELVAGEWDELRCTVAFAKLSGVRYLDGPLRQFASRGGKTAISVGVDHDGTSFEAVSQLLGAVWPHGEVFVAKHLGSPSPTFHPKVFLFTAGDLDRRSGRALLLSGSTNLTEGGLFTNYEFASAWTPNMADRAEVRSLREVVASLDGWAGHSSGLCVKLDANNLLEFHELGLLPTEAQILATKASSFPPSRGAMPARSPAGLRRQRRPAKVRHSTRTGPPAVALPTAPVTTHRARSARTTASGPPAAHKAFVIDILTGRALTEIFLSQVALREDPAFFGHPFSGRTAPRRGPAQPELQPRPVVDILLIGADSRTISEYREREVKIWEYVYGPSRTMDVRMIIPQELLRSLPAGCILVMHRSPVRTGLDYRLEFLTPGSAAWNRARALASKPLAGGKRMFGWL